MMGFIKLAGFGAVLGYGAITAYDLPTRKLEAALSGKIQDRLADAPLAPAPAVPVAFPVPLRQGKGDRLVASDGACTGRTGTLHAVACSGPRDGGGRRAPLTIAIGTRGEVETSTLVRRPQITTAQR
ncbi:MAG TPA: hypothetical protein VHL98_13460 [Microvirga sp.]|jgi:hypothetical protein|nr:hypothetical protein [Microvirga sp.]